MRTNADNERLTLVRAKFAPLAQMLDHLAKDIEKDYGESAVLKQRGSVEPTAQNTYAVRYSLRHPDNTRLALTFIVTGEEADLLLLQVQERSGAQDNQAHPGQVDQRVYRLEKVEEITQAVQEKISAYLRTGQAGGTPRAA